MTAPVLEVEHLDVGYGRGRKTTQIVRDVSFRIEQGKTLGLVGESGSGKSTIGRAIVGLAPVLGGSIRLDGREIGQLDRRGRRAVAADLQVVFQDPYSSLNPAVTIEEILTEPLEAQGWRRKDARVRSAEMLDRVGLPASAGKRFVSGFSGGQRQRIAIARSLMSSPRLVICDEAVSALDLSVQAQVLNLLRDLQDTLDISYLFIGHNLEVVQFIADDFAVLHRGELVETGPADQVMRSPQDPYTRRLVSAILSPDPQEQRERREMRLVGARADLAAEISEKGNA